MDAPYRELAAVPAIQAASREGKVSLELGPQLVRLALGERMELTVRGQAATWVRHRGGPGRELGRARLWAARSFPTRDLALWYERKPGQAERLGGVRAVTPFEPGALGAWRALDRVADELCRALDRLEGGGGPAVELGRGHHRVLLVELAGRLVVYARPLFRERARRVLEVGRDGSLTVPGRRRDRSVRFESRAQVTVSGDRVRFIATDGRDLVSLWLPWIAIEDRQELVRRFGELVVPLPPEPDYEPRAALRPWASGLGRVPPVAALMPAPLPYTVHGRWRR